MEGSDYYGVHGIFSKLSNVHGECYIHGDVTRGNLWSGDTLSVDTETFGKGDYRTDLIKGRKQSE